MLLVFGSIGVDLVFPVSRLPGRGVTGWSEGGCFQAGGRGANQAVAAARDGTQVAMVGAVGRDVLAETALSGLAAAGVRLDAIARVEARTGHSAICVDPEGYTTVVTHAGANRFARAAQVSDSLLGPSTTLLLQMETDVKENALLIARARQSGARIVLNFSPPRTIGAETLRAVDVLVGNGEELAWLGEHLGTGNNPASLHGALGVTTVRMLGVQGTEAVSAAGFVRMPAMPVAMRDTTAAADCFVGVVTAALERDESLTAGLRRASVAAALSVTVTGPQNSMPSRTEIDDALPGAPEPTTEQPQLPD